MSNNLGVHLDKDIAVHQTELSSTKTNEHFFITPVDESNFSLDKISAFHHNYQSHPLLQLNNIEQLAKRLYPTKNCRFIARDTKINSDFNHKDSSFDGRNITEVFQRIEEPGSWIAIYNIQIDPIYQQFILEVLGSAQHLIPNYKNLFDIRGYFFISSPPSLTPFHMDTENNFWLQINGRKTLNTWDRNDPNIVPTSGVEHFIIHNALDKVIFREEIMPFSQEFDCGPGDGVYFPCTTPHMTRSDPSWVSPGNGFAVSLAVVFYNDDSRHAAYVHAFNSVLRRLMRFNPRPPRQSKFIDSIKYPFGHLAVALGSFFLNYKRPRGF